MFQLFDLNRPRRTLASSRWLLAVVATTFLVLPRDEAFVMHPRLTTTTSPSDWQKASPLAGPARVHRFHKQSLDHQVDSTTRTTTTTRLAMSFLPQDLVLALHPLPPNDHKNLLEIYGTLLKIYPLTTKATTAALLAFSGDAIAQYASIQSSTSASPNKKNNDNNDDDDTTQYDLARGLTFMLFGAVYTGAFQHFWFSYLTQHIVEWGQAWHVWGPQHAALPADDFDAVVNSKEWWSYFDIVSQMEQAPSDAIVAAAKVAVNQFLIIPTVYMPLFFWVTGNFSLQKAMARARNLYLPLLKRNYVYWLPMQFAQFFLLPPEWQIPFVSAASLVWTVILSSIGSSTAAAAAVVATSPPAALPEPVMAPMDELSLPPSSSLQSKQDNLENNAEGTGLAPTVVETVVVAIESSSEARDVTEQVSLNDVRDALVPASVVQTAETVSSAATGLTLGLVTSAADDAALGAVIGSLVGGEKDLGVAVSAAMGAGVFLLGTALQQEANHKQQQQQENQKDDLQENSSVIDVVSIVADDDDGFSGNPTVERNDGSLKQDALLNAKESIPRNERNPVSETEHELVSKER